MIRRFVLLLSLMLTHTGTVIAQSAVDYREFNFPEIGRLQLQNPILDLEVVGSTVYAALGNSGLAILDLYDVSNPVLRDNEPQAEDARRLVCGDDLLWVAAKTGGLLGYEVEPDGDLNRLADLTGIGEVWDVTLNGSMAYVATSDQGLRVVDISDPAMPTLVGTISLGGPCYEVANLVDAVYVQVSGSGLMVVDVSSPAFPVLAGSLDTPAYVSTLTVAGTRLYHSSAYDQWAWDLANPLSPVLLGTTGIGLETRTELIAVGTTTYTSGNDMGAVAVDWSAPSAPQITGTCSDTYFGTALAWIDGHLVSGDYYGLLRTLQPVPLQPNPRLARLAVVDYALCMTRSGNLLALGCQPNRLDLIDMSHPTEPAALGSVDLPVDPAQVLILNGTAIVRINRLFDNVRLVDISDPMDPTILATPVLPRWLEMESWNDQVLILDEDGCLVVYDFSEPLLPIEVGRSLSLGTNVYDFEVVGNVVWAAKVGGGLTGIDLSDPTMPVVISELPAVPDMGALLAVGGTLLGAEVSWSTETGGLRAIDISNPSSPQPVAYEPIVGLHSFSLARLGDIVYAAEWNGGFLAFDISTPSDPTYISAFATAGFSEQVMAYESANGSVVLSASSAAGLEVYPLQIMPEGASPVPLVEVPEYLRVHPNPFNPSCSLSFDLSRTEDVSIHIFDVMGRKVVTLISGRTMVAGPHEVTWRGVDAAGREVPSGIYFALVSSPSVQTVGKLTLVR